ncbi:MAG: 23S rRNA (guanosine(2251)-2'-O)-methyltransferase RlmB [Chloroflexi bacterium]|nr:23S rRNA (guanosine(2251)-2'-O)-methyltransferase RlmB [Chloroflexota bacterium]
MEILAGRNAIREALLAGRRRFESVTLAENMPERGPVIDIQQMCQARGVPLGQATRRELDQMADELTHQGMVARVSAYPYADLDETLANARSTGEDPFLLVLDELQDPQNVGALLRTAETAGVHGVIIAAQRAAQITPAVSRASAGAAEHMRIARVTNIAKTLTTLRDAGLWIAGIEDHPDAQDYRAVDLDRPLALVLGSEGRGMRPLVAKQCDFLLRIPMRGHINSLNVSAAGAIVIYQALSARIPRRDAQAHRER